MTSLRVAGLKAEISMYDLHMTTWLHSINTILWGKSGKVKTRNQNTV
jgi:hypothetical protein